MTALAGYGDSYALGNVRAPACLIDGPLPGPVDATGLVDFHLIVEGGKIAGFLSAATATGLPGPDRKRGIVLPGLIDLHTHLDKGHIWPRAPNPDGTPQGAFGTVGDDRAAHWNADDVEARFEFALRTAYAHGVVAIRTHLDSLAPQAAISFPLFARLRARWAGRIELQATSLAPADIFLTDQGRELADLVAAHGGQLGFGTRMRGETGAAPSAAFDQATANLFALAAERGLDVDLHVDESSDPAARALPNIAKIARAGNFRSDILVGHCCALALQDDAQIEMTLDRCADAGIAVVSLPSCNMYLQDRKAGRTPRWRGVTLLHEMRARGLRVAVAGDNVRDPYYAYGDHDMLETFVQAVRILQLDHPVGDWPRAVSATPAAIMKLPQAGMLRVGAPADLLLLEARSYSELLSRRQSDRIVLRAGKPIDTAPPSYAELDAVVGPP